MKKKKRHGDNIVLIRHKKNSRLVSFWSEFKMKYSTINNKCAESEYSLPQFVANT